MEFFNQKAVRLRSHLDKYLVADEDQQTVRQSRNGSTRKARWIVEIVDTNSHAVRLRSCYGRYLTASSSPFLLGMTGNKVAQTVPENIKDFAIEWQPIRDGFQVKIRGFGGKYLRANGATLPWRNSVTHDNPYSNSTNNWILWTVEGVNIPEDEQLNDYLSTMDLFHNAKVVRILSSHGKYLTAQDDEESVTQNRQGDTEAAKWTVELLPVDHNNYNIIRLKSCYNKYLTASNQPFLLGMTGRKVLQTMPDRLDSSVEWKPLRNGDNQVKFRARYGQFLRANGGPPPWRNSITHDIPQRTATQDWIIWYIDVVETVSPKSMQELFADHSDSFSSTESSTPDAHASFSGPENRATSFQQVPAMDLFPNANAVRIRSSHGKYLTAQDDEESVTQDRQGDSEAAKWTVEFLPADGNNYNIIRLKSCYNKYLTASNQPFLLRMTGRKVLQTMPDRLDSSVEWELLRDGDGQVKFRTRYGQFLRANGGLPPWRNSITHDIPRWTATQDWIFWYIDC